uniref:Uncharacterized protein n=1 Tax=Panagrolaimus sp. PS1159 TaxID=55785 RepID=A0AC35GR92_9BILA
MIMLQTALNCLTIKGTLIINNCCTVAKIVAMFGIIGLGVYALFTNEDATASYKDSFIDSSLDPGAIARAFYSALFAYQGWNYLNFIVEEVKNPVKTLPRAVLISSFAIIVIYLLVNMAFYTGLTPTMLAGSTAATIDFIEKIFPDFKYSGYFVSFLVAVSCFGSGNGVIFTSSRIFFVGARNDQMPKFLLMTNPKYKSPIPAVLLTGFLSILFLIPGDDAIKIINYIAISYWLAIGVATVALFYYRCRIPKHEYPFRVPLPIPIIFTIGCAFLVVFPFFSQWLDALIGIGIMATGIPVYLIFVRFRCKPLDSVADNITKVVQILWLVYDESANEKATTASATTTNA